MRMGIWHKKPITAIPTSKPAAAPGDMKIEINPDAGMIRIEDSRLFRDDRRGWCRELADFAAGSGDVRWVSLDLQTASCEIRFLAAPSAHDMAGLLAASMRAADASSSGRSFIPRGWFARRPRKPQDWTSLTAFPGGESASIWTSCERCPGLIEIEHPSLSESTAGHDRLIGGLLARFPTLRSCKFNPCTRRLEVQLEPDRIALTEVMVAAQSLFAGNSSGTHGIESLALVNHSSAAGPTLLVTGPKRLLFLGLGGGSFAMIFVGLAIPGIPTVPFVMLSSYYLARSSTRLHGRLARSRLLGPVVREWSRYQGLSKTSKGKLAALTLLVVAGSLVLVGITPIVLIVTFVLSTAGLISLLRLPGIDEANVFSHTPSRLPALPSPAM
jgi:uncharacterized membrane protein YbaN (DUF454 family)